jgi:hypothetical protein
MSLYAEYIKEREGYLTIEEETFFVTFKKIEDALYVRDIYIVPEHRSKKMSVEIGKLTETIAKQMECKALLGSVDKGTYNWERNKEIMIKFGYNQVSEDGDYIQFQKELNNG